MASKVLEKSADVIQKPKLHLDDLAMIEDELKPEYDVLNNLIKLVTKTKSNLEMISNENRLLHSTIESLRSEMTGEFFLAPFKSFLFIKLLLLNIQNFKSDQFNV